MQLTALTLMSCALTFAVLTALPLFSPARSRETIDVNDDFSSLLLTATDWKATSRRHSCPSCSA